MSKKTKQLILIVDDVTSNIDVLLEVLGDEHEISVAMDGLSALEFVAKTTPDLILLDVMMPDMDGFEVCQRLKSDGATRDIPIIFITALDDQKSERKGLEYGAVDYISKPFNGPVVAARVRNHLLIKQQRDQLQQSISLLDHKNELLEQKAELGIQAGGLAHDMANVFSSAMFIEWLLPEEPPTDLQEWQEILQDAALITSSIKLGEEICRGFTSYLRNIGEEPDIHTFDELLPVINMYARQFGGALVKDIEPGVAPIKCKPYQIKRVIVNLLVNAQQAVKGKEEPEVRLRLFEEKQQVCFSVQDNGVGIDPTVLPHIFEERFTTKEHGTGLGLFLTKQIMDSHGASIAVESDQGKGTTIILSFPPCRE